MQIALLTKNGLKKTLGWLGVLALSLVAALVFVTVAYAGNVLLGFVSGLALLMPIGVIIFFSEAKFRVWWGRANVALLPMGLIVKFELGVVAVNFALFIFFINLLIIITDKLLGTPRSPRRRSFIHWPLLIWFAVIILSTALSRQPYYGFMDLIPLLLAGSVFAYLRNYVESEEEVERLIKFFAVGVGYALLIGLMEVQTGHLYGPLFRQSNITADFGTDLRATGPFDNANSYAYFAGIGALFFAPLFFHWKDWKWKLVSVGFFLSGTLLVINTFSRGGLIGFAGGLVFMLLALAPPGKKLVIWMIIIPMVLGAGVVFLTSGVGGKRSLGVSMENIEGSIQTAMLTGDEEALNDIISFAARPIIWINALSFWSESPLIGIGHHNFLFRFHAVAPDILSTILYMITHTHNIFINTLTEEGLIGLGCLIAIIIQLLRYLIGGIRHRRTMISYLAIGLAAVFVHIFTHGLIDSIIVIGGHSVETGIFFLMLAFSSFVADAVKKRRQQEKLAAVR
jgi:putative inorganic carbon (HCO3(-)) transporter